MAQAVLPKPCILSSHVCPTHFIFHHLIVLKIFGDEYKSCRCFLYTFMQPRFTFCLLQPDIALRSTLLTYLFIYFLTYLLTPWCRVLLEKLTGLQLVKKFPAFHGTRRFIRNLSLSWASPIQSIYPHPTSWRSILILSTHLRLGLSSGLLPSGFPRKTLYNPLSSPIRATCPAHLILLDFITRTILGEEYKYSYRSNLTPTHDFAF